MPSRYFYTGPSHWAGKQSGDQIAESKDEAVSNIDALHNSGIPFFTKDRIRYIHEQLKKTLKKGDKVAVQGVNGVTIYFDVVTGDIHKDHENEDMELVM
ncbi:hypothetical protein PHISCL_00841 [Aspergillus sclerotialis]|uniref:Uncharacterized protein n=1 Tax=Aspergillus sclerotialis TaxID=2070753 RepID=A0A3A2ZUS6_9EURO|nr:hypothetical protein PHISCL_00841 [Aspergillus sclerotialis]